MTTGLYCEMLLAAAIFVVACAVRAVRFARMPLHLRWELYPVPHEGARAGHGGSYFESADWWTAPRHFSLLAELRFMVPEILFLKALREFNPGLWRRSYPFHAGLYLLAATGGLLLLTAFADLLVGGFASGPAGRAAYWLGAGSGLAGAALTVAGAIGLLHRRVTDPGLRAYTTAGDLFNLAFFLGVAGLLTAGHVLRPAGSPGAVAVVRGLLTWDTSLRVPALLASGIAAGAALVAYVPLTHMSHFIAKYFTYHQVRWDDAPSHGDRALQARMVEQLTYRPTWTAAHVRADGQRNWGELAAINPARESHR